MVKIYYSRHCVHLGLALLLAAPCAFFPDVALAEQGFARKNATFLIQQTVSGLVLDGLDGKPMVGASVAVKGGGQSTSTDANGAFSLQVPDNNAVLVIRYVGYITQEITVGSRSRLEITLKPDQAELAQVVVVGYGTQNKKDITGAVKSLKSEEFNKGIISSPQQLLQGKVSGVNVTAASGEPGAATGITVRGPGGLRTGSTPLFVIDGLPLDNSSTGGGDPLAFINTQDIESIDVLKDASATAIYGSRGANGVIIVTTKRGKAGTSMLGFSSSVGISKIARALPVFTAAQFRTEVPKVGGVLDDKGGDTDWQDEITRQGLTQNYNLNLSGGSEKLSYFASLGSQQEEGIIRKNQMGRYSGRFNATQKFLDDRLMVDVNISANNTKNSRPPITSLLNDAIVYNPTYPARNSAGAPAVYQGTNNPLLYLDLNKEITTINRVIGNISPSLRILKGLVYKLNFGVDNSTSTRDVESLPSTVPLIDGRLETYYNINKNTLIENYLTWNWSNDKHNVSALGGHSFQKIFVQGRNYSINKFIVGNADPIYNPGVGQELTLANNRPGGFAFNNELQSFFGRVTYQYNSKYLLTANFRTDGSSKFGANNKYGYFPSFSLGWKISEESFLKNSMFSNLMLRAGYGITGNQEIPPKITQALFSSLASASYPLNSTSVYAAGTTYSRLANPDIQWETSKQTNIGLDFGLFNGALSGTLDVFNKVSDNILLQVIPADPVQPASTVWSNVKDMTVTNKGVEFALNYSHTTGNNFTYNIGGNITHTKNKVENSPYSIIPSGSVSGAGITSSTINGYLNGQPIGTFFLKEFTGFDANGLSTYRDLDGDNIITDKDRISAGTAVPDMLYSVFGSVAFKGFDLSVNMNGVSGNKTYDYTANVGFSKLRLAKNVNATPESVANTKESINNAAMVSTRYLKDGAYFRLNNASLGYNFNTSKLGIGWANTLRLSVTGQNLFVITKYDGYDPEVNADRAIGGVSSYGIDFLSYPRAKSVIFGLNLSF
ncbi:SusC/RagA family TonB-linked outer membrane protein [Daejeonella lutea]|uniref:Iron complex outermembrane recepter protein n=1 Tax=Daejeonella lutea TaxID=572036 RepID=A0A1T5AFE1_9SPHI|nr:TonB-dependent receptor [Daejeonella lutea]SKB33373.1 iron complex outermembrane recepter protein [Daejeonella lutea]